MVGFGVAVPFYCLVHLNSQFSILNFNCLGQPKGGFPKQLI